MNKKYTILIVDDKSENLKYLNEILACETYDIRATTSSLMALDAAKRFKPDLILLDIKMPELDGYQLCKQIKKEENLKEIPIIFISALDDIEDKIKAFDNGGVDYITKPFEPKEVQARIKTQLEIYNSKHMIAKLLEQQDLFIKKIMHEMNTPVSIISLNSELIEQEHGSSCEIDAIRASTKTLSSIYGDLSYLIKHEKKRYEIQKIDLLNFVSTRIMFFDELANTKKLHLNLEYTENYDVFINKYEFERILDNIISNAIKFSKEHNEINIFFGIENHNHILEVEDFGIGLETPKKIFDAYYQQSYQKQGLGLGLNIVKEICDKYLIPIEVTSTKNKGSKFTFILDTITKEQL